MGFDVPPSAYDAFMGRYSVPLAPRFAEFAGLGRRDRALDVGCGTGALTTLLAEQLGVASVAAVDPSPGFVAHVRQQCPGVDVRQGHAEALPFPERSFDSALAQLVVHFMSDPVGGLREMARVVRPGGTVAACVWDHAGDRGPLGLFWTTVRTLDPAARDESELPGARQGHLEELLHHAGLGGVRGEALTVEVGHATFDEWWIPFTRGVGPAGAYVAGLGDVQRERLREACRRRVPSGPFTIVARAWAAAGTIPATATTPAAGP